ncbi:hypothetical protein GW17_00057178, partial [Ensete ventricosum]
MGGTSGSYPGGRLLEWWSSGRKEAPQLKSGTSSCKKVESGAFIVSVVDPLYLITLLSLRFTMSSYLSTMPLVLVVRRVSVDAMVLDKDVCGVAGCGIVDEPGIVVNLCSTCFWEFLVEEEPQWPAARLLRPAVAGGATDRSVCNLSHSLDAMALEKDVCGAAGCGIVDEPGIVNLCSTCFWEFLVEEEPQWPAARLLRPAAAGGATPSSASEVPSADG